MPTLEPSPLVPLRLSWQRLDGLYCLAFALAIAIAFRISVTIGGVPSIRTLRSTPTSTVVAAFHRPRVDTNIIADIVRGHLFGESPSIPAAGASRISLTLSGVIALPDPTRGYAIVAADGGAAHLYAAGAPLPGPATLLEVYRDRVIVDQGGTRLELRLPLRMAGLQFAALAMTDGAPDRLNAGAPRFGSADFQAKALDVLPVSTGAARVLRPEAVVEDGKLHGYQVFPADPDKLGVSSGDELVAINGHGLQDAAGAARVMEELDSSTAANVKLTLLHNGQSYDLIVSADALRRHRP
jgi:type II secretion system protein C